MIVQFIEATNAGFNHGKFMLARLDYEERAAKSALPGYEDHAFMTLGGLRAFNPSTTLVFDMQTGEGAVFALRGLARADLAKHKIWVCPMYEPFLVWLYEQGLGDGQGDITALPRFIDLGEIPGALYGHRREGEATS